MGRREFAGAVARAAGELPASMGSGTALLDVLVIQGEWVKPDARWHPTVTLLKQVPEIRRLRYAEKVGLLGPDMPRCGQTTYRQVQFILIVGRRI